MERVQVALHLDSDLLEDFLLLLEVFFVLVHPVLRVLHNVHQLLLVLAHLSLRLFVRVHHLEVTVVDLLLGFHCQVSEVLRLLSQLVNLVFNALESFDLLLEVHFGLVDPVLDALAFLIRDHLEVIEKDELLLCFLFEVTFFIKLVSVLVDVLCRLLEVITKLANLSLDILRPVNLTVELVGERANYFLDSAASCRLHVEILHFGHHVSAVLSLQDGVDIANHFFAENLCLSVEDLKLVRQR